MHNIKKVYLYLVSVISLVIWIIGAIILLNMALKTWVFTKADQDYYSYPACPVEVVDGTKSVSTCNEAEQQKRAQDSRVAQKQRDAAQATAMIVVAVPVWYVHWRWARKEA